jgi:hypothetical protein
MGLPAALQTRLGHLTDAEKRELNQLGITRQKRWDWINMDRHPTAAQLRTLAVILDLEPAPLLLWLAEKEATPAQLELFLRALVKGAAALSLVILAGAESDANAASMRVGASPDALTVAHIMRSTLQWMRERNTCEGAAKQH